MPRINTRVTFDRKAAAAKIKAADQAALTDMGNQALLDTTDYVPRDSGILQDSGLLHSDFKAEDGKFTIRWDTPYAQYLWHGDVMHGTPKDRTYGPEKLSFTSALAREEWAKYAKETHGSRWRQVYEAALRKELRK